MPWRTAAACLLAAASGAAPAAAQAVDRPEPGAREAIAAATTQPRFLSPWVSDVPDHPTVPSPTDHLGHIAGAPGELTRTDRIYAYYRALDAASDRVSVEVAGKTEEGRDILLVLVGDAAAVAAADRIRQDMAAIADPRKHRRGRAGADRGRHEADLHAPRRPALHRDGQPGDAHGAGLPPRRLRGPAHPPDPRPRAGAGEPGGGAGRARPHRGLVLPAPEGQDRLREPAPEVAALLGQIRLPRQQPRRHPAQARAHPRHPGRVPALAPGGRARPARVHPAALDLDRHRAVQRPPRSRASPRNGTPSRSTRCRP